jgi:iron complex outermembrane receptor protein
LVGNGNGALYYNNSLGSTVPNPAVTDPYTMNTNRDAPGVLRDHNRIHLDVTWDLGGSTLKYLAGYQEYAYDTGGDYDGGNRTDALTIPLPGFAPLTVDFDGAAGPLTPFTFVNPSFTATNVRDPHTFYTESQRWWSNEVNLSSNGEGAVQWIVGLFQYDQTYDQPQGIRVPDDPGLAAPLNSAIANPDRNILLVDGHLETESYAGFGQIDWSVAENWTLTVGARYTKDKKKGLDYARLIARGPTTAIGAADSPGVLEGAIVGQVRTLTGNPAMTPAQVDAFLRSLPAANRDAILNGVSAAVLAQTQAGGLDVTQTQVCGAVACPADMRASPRGGLERDLAGDWDAVTGTVGLRWEPTESTDTYLRYSRGYKSGGWLGSNGLTLNPYADPEYVNSYELGFKQAVSSFQFNTALYFNDYQGFQAPLTVQRDQSTESRFLNLDAETYGVEIETVWSPIDALQLFVNYAYLHTEITDGCCFVDSADPTAAFGQPVSTLPNGRVAQTLEGNQLPLSPENKWTFGFNYTLSFTPGSLTFTGMYTDTDDMQTSIWGNPAYTAPSFEIADFRLLWTDAQDRYTVIGFVKNAFDELGYGSVTPSSPTAVGVRRDVSLTFPRTYGMELQFRF